MTARRLMVANLDACSACGGGGMIRATWRVPAHRCQDCFGKGYTVSCEDCSMALENIGEQVNGVDVLTCPKCVAKYGLEAPHNEVREEL